MNGFLPLTTEEMTTLGWELPEFCIVSGDAYIDHPSFGTAIISRILERAGFRVAIIAQPDWHATKDFMRFGKPKLGFLVTAGNLDSMVAHYTVNKRKRSEDAYTPGGVRGKRPDRACIVYTNRIREAYGDIPVILGGIEASLRRFAHYDYWDDRVRHSVLVDAGADLLVYGMGEKPIVDIAQQLARGIPVKQIHDVPGTAYAVTALESDAGVMPGFSDVSTDMDAYNKAFMMQQQHNDEWGRKALAQSYEKGFIVANAPPKPMNSSQMDEVYALPYMRGQHPSYTREIPALSEALFSLTSNRGCFGGCSFCALHYHQGRTVQARSHASLIAEAKTMTKDPRFKGYIHDVGGPTANFRQPSCKQQLKYGVCKDKSCLVPRCENLDVSHWDYLSLLRKLRGLDGVKKVFVRSGIRYDYVMYDRDKTFLEELLVHHVSGQLRVAPEHTAPTVLHLMGKPEDTVYERFCQRFEAIKQNNALDLYLVPYFMSSHPGSNMDAAIALACEMKKTGQRPEQVQDFYPTPGTLSTAMYYTGMDPRDGRAVYVPKSNDEKRMQRALLQYFMLQNAVLVRRALMEADREDLIGFDSACLVKPAFDRTNERPTVTQSGTKNGKSKSTETGKGRTRPNEEIKAMQGNDGRRSKGAPRGKSTGSAPGGNYRGNKPAPGGDSYKARPAQGQTGEGGEARPQRSYSSGRPTQNRDGYRPRPAQGQTAEGGEARPQRSYSSGRPTQNRDGYRPRPAQGQTGEGGEARPKRSYSSDRPAQNRDGYRPRPAQGQTAEGGEARPQRTFRSDRPTQNRDGYRPRPAQGQTGEGGEARPQRTYSSDRPTQNRDGYRPRPAQGQTGEGGEARPQRTYRSDRPTQNRDGYRPRPAQGQIGEGGEARPQRSYSSDRPAQNRDGYRPRPAQGQTGEGGESRPKRSYSSERPTQNRDGYRPRPAQGQTGEGGEARPQRSYSSDRPTQNRDGYRPRPAQGQTGEGGEARPQRSYSSDRPAQNRDGYRPRPAQGQTGQGGEARPKRSYSSDRPTQNRDGYRPRPAQGQTGEGAEARPKRSYSSDRPAQNRDGYRPRSAQGQTGEGGEARPQRGYQGSKPGGYPARPSKSTQERPNAPRPAGGKPAPKSGMRPTRGGTRKP